MLCGAVMVWWHGKRCVRRIHTQVFRPHGQVGCSQISTWFCLYSGSAAPRSTSKPQIASGEGVACIQQPATAPDLALGQHLYALAASQPALSRQTRELANRFTHVRLPTSPLLPQTHEYDHDLSSRLDQMLTVRSSEFAACFTIF